MTHSIKDETLYDLNAQIEESKTPCDIAVAKAIYQAIEDMTDKEFNVYRLVEREMSDAIRHAFPESTAYKLLRPNAIELLRVLRGEYRPELDAYLASFFEPR